MDVVTLRNPYHGPAGQFCPEESDVGQAGRIPAHKRVDLLPPGTRPGSRRVPFPTMAPARASEIYQQADEATQVVVSVPIDKLVASQDSVHADLVKGYLDKKVTVLDRELKPRDTAHGQSVIPLVIEHDGQYVIADGTHRAVAAWARGAKTLQVIKRSAVKTLSYRDRLALHLKDERSAEDRSDAARRAWDIRGRKDPEAPSLNGRAVETMNARLAMGYKTERSFKGETFHKAIEADWYQHSGTDKSTATLKAKLDALAPGSNTFIAAEPDNRRLVANGALTVVDPYKHTDRLGKSPNQSHRNVAEVYFSDPDRYDIATGYAAGDFDGRWRSHSWLVEKDSGKIVETTPAYLTHYFGERLTTKAEAAAFTWANVGVSPGDLPGLDKHRIFRRQGRWATS